MSNAHQIFASMSPYPHDFYIGIDRNGGIYAYSHEPEHNGSGEWNVSDGDLFYLGHTKRGIFSDFAWYDYFDLDVDTDNEVMNWEEDNTLFHYRFEPTDKHRAYLEQQISWLKRMRENLPGYIELVVERDDPSVYFDEIPDFVRRAKGGTTIELTRTVITRYGVVDSDNYQGHCMYYGLQPSAEQERRILLSRARSVVRHSAQS